jgi:hypothetical protein
MQSATGDGCQRNVDTASSTGSAESLYSADHPASTVSHMRPNQRKDSRQPATELQQRLATSDGPTLSTVVTARKVGTFSICLRQMSLTSAGVIRSHGPGCAGSGCMPQQSVAKVCNALKSKTPAALPHRPVDVQQKAWGLALVAVASQVLLSIVTNQADIAHLLTTVTAPRAGAYLHGN